MPVNASPEKIEELRTIVRQLVPFAINIFQAFIDRDPDRIADEFVALMHHADQAGILD